MTHVSLRCLTIAAATAGVLVAFGCSGTTTDAAATGGSGGSGGTTGADAGQDAAADSAPADGGGDAAPGWVECFGEDGNSFQWAITQCTGTTCEVVEHQVNCCGTKVLIGVDGSKKALFDACEAAWRASLPGCGCAQGPATVQRPSGTVVTGPEEAQATCENWTSTSGICLTSKK